MPRGARLIRGARPGAADFDVKSRAMDPRDPIIQFILFLLLMLAPLWMLGC